MAKTVLGGGKDKVKQARQSSFYFTYGSSEKMPFQGGWTVVKALDRHDACKKFIAKHPLTSSGLVNCSSIYSGDYFRTTTIYKNKSNLGKGQQELIK